jgi:serine/threonine protein kinase
LVPRLSIEPFKVESGKITENSNLSQDKTVRNESRRHASAEVKNSHSSSAKSLGGQLDTCRKEQEESKRERLLQGLVNSARNGNVLLTTSSFYMIGKQLGKGAFGKVYLGLHRITGLKVAIKTIDKSIIEDERTRRKVFQEVYVMKRVNHQNVIRLLEVFESSKHLMIVLEYSGGGDLLQLVKSRGHLTETEGKNIFSQVIDAVKACHDKNIIHRDVKLDNILITTDFTCVKLCDFGVSRTVKPNEKIFDQCGTPAYLAPEIVADRGYDPFFVDIWSMGVLLYAILSGTVPFRAKSLQELHKLILRCKYQMPENVSENAQDLIRRMLNPIPHLRISLEEMKKHPWFEQFLGDSAVEDSIAPRFLGNFWASVRRCSEKEIIGRMSEMGFESEFVYASLRNKEINHVTATYYLMEIAGV